MALGRGRPDAAPRGRRQWANLAREARSWPTLLVTAVCLFGGLPLVVLLTPDQQVHVFGQLITVGARDPQLSLSGPAQVVQIGNTRLDLPRVQVYGPIRPRLSLGPVDRNDVALRALDPQNSARVGTAAVQTLIDGFVRWYLWGAVGIVAVAVAISGLGGCVRMLVVLDRANRRPHDPVPVARLWHGLSGAIGRMTAVAVTVSVLVWVAGGALAYEGTTRGLAGVSSLTDLVGTTQVTPSPVGPPVSGFVGAVIGDSRVARLGGPPVPDADDKDSACARSSDSLAAELTLMRSAPVLNLACQGASISRGLRSTQVVGPVIVPPQIGVLKQVQNLRFVVVAIGPNDLNWADFLLYCYGLASCNDRLTDGEFAYRIAAFDQDYAALLQDLDGLPGRPQVIIMTSYDAFVPGTGPDCPDARGPLDVAGLDADKIELLSERNTQLNAVLEAGADKYGFTVARPDVTPLCGSHPDGLGPDLQGLSEQDPFHPTAIGSLRLAASVAQAIERPQP